MEHLFCEKHSDDYYVLLTGCGFELNIRSTVNIKLINEYHALGPSKSTYSGFD